MAETTSCARCELTLVRASDNGEWIDLDGYVTCPFGVTDGFESAEHQAVELADGEVSNV